MPRNGSGVYSYPSNSWSPAVAGTDLDSQDWNSLAADLATAVSQSIASTGVTTITANLPMNDFKHTGVGNASARTQYSTYGQAQDGAMSYAAGSGTDTYTATLAPAIAAYVTGATYRILIPNANTVTNPTLNLNSLGAKTIVSGDNSALNLGQLNAGALYDFTYDGVSFRTSATDFGGVLALTGGTLTGAPNITYVDSGTGGLAVQWEVNSGTPAAADLLTYINFNGRDSGGNLTTYAQLIPVISDPTNGSEDGEIYITANVAGVLTERIRATAAGVTVTGTLATAGTGKIAPGNNANYWLQFDGTNPVITVDSTDDWYYDRSVNTFVWRVGGTNVGLSDANGFHSQTNAKAWIFVTLSGSTPTIAESFNVASLTDNGVGDFTVNFTTAMPNANYAVQAIAEFTGAACIAGMVQGGLKSTTQCQIQIRTFANAAADVNWSAVFFATGT